ncbi:hypothetical protein [Rhodococcus sp. IEGM 1408]|uniref:hypothetical protein n=1 Tax=Rhodococcus sp. IEGM 1408 TaxID=3082220 RepID=UPI002955A953|nr:hypothetical protein [Rhodococcus sp. IEGM 1408]MDV8003176.1 hypothetical protein [Rhodococcus sp. IEGM 1408]
MIDDTGHDTSPLHAVPDTPTPAADTGTARWSANALKWSAAQAARETGAARSTILEAIKSGRLEATKDEAGAWQIAPEALGAAGFRQGKPTLPDPVPVLEDRADADEFARLRLELVSVRADARVLTVERDAERRLREAAERERDVYRRMIEAPREVAPSAPQTVEPATPMPIPHPAPTPPPTAAPGAGRPQAGWFRRKWDAVKSG